jgi:hypothetical protein
MMLIDVAHHGLPSYRYVEAGGSSLRSPVLNHRIRRVCDSCWPELYTTRYGREPRYNAKEEYKQLALHSGRVVRYVGSGDKTKYMVRNGKEFYINAHGECFFNDVLLEKDALDIGYEAARGGGVLLALTRSHISAYTLRNLQFRCREELVGAKRLVLAGDECQPEMEDGEVRMLDLWRGSYGLIEIKEPYMVQLEDGSIVELDIRRDKVVRYYEQAILLTESGVYLSQRADGDLPWKVKLHPTQGRPVAANERE